MPALVNLVFGNVSMMPGVRLVDLSFPGPRARRIRGSSTRRGRCALAHRRARPPPARHRAQAAGGAREPARGDGGRLRPRRGRHRQGRPEPHRRIRGVQGPGEAVCGRGGRREPAHRAPLPLPPPRHRPPARARPPVRVRGASRTPRRARRSIHRRARHQPIARPRPRPGAHGAPDLRRGPLRLPARGHRPRTPVRDAAAHRGRGHRDLPQRRGPVPTRPRGLRGHREPARRAARPAAARVAVSGRRDEPRAPSPDVRRLRPPTRCS